MLVPPDEDGTKGEGGGGVRGATAAYPIKAHPNSMNLKGGESTADLSTCVVAFPHLLLCPSLSFPLILPSSPLRSCHQPGHQYQPAGTRPYRRLCTGLHSRPPRLRPSGRHLFVLPVISPTPDRRPPRRLSPPGRHALPSRPAPLPGGGPAGLGAPQPRPAPALQCGAAPARPLLRYTGAGRPPPASSP